MFLFQSIRDGVLKKRIDGHLIMTVVDSLRAVSQRSSSTTKSDHTPLCSLQLRSRDTASYSNKGEFTNRLQLKRYPLKI